MKRTLLAILLVLPAAVGHADTGIRLLSVTCTSSSLTVEPFVAWNEETSKYPEAQQKGKSKNVDTTVFHFSKRHSDTVRTSCTIEGRTFQIVVSQGELELVEGKKVLMHRVIDDVWDIYGPVYRVRYTRGGWSEYCGHVERNPIWRTARFEETNTNCR